MLNPSINYHNKICPHFNVQKISPDILIFGHTSAIVDKDPPARQQNRALVSSTVLLSSVEDFLRSTIKQVYHIPSYMSNFDSFVQAAVSCTLRLCILIAQHSYNSRSLLLLKFDLCRF